MSKKKSGARRKRRTREHVIADLSVNYFERQVLLCGYTIEEVVHDYGIDLFIITYDEQGHLEPDEIRVQVKATDKPRFIKHGEYLSFPIETGDLQSWLQELSPVILIVYNVAEDEAYWLYVQAYLQQKTNFKLDLSKAQTTVHIPRTNVLDPEAVSRFNQFKKNVLAQQEGVQHNE